MVQLTIDGRVVTAANGASVLEAARAAGCDIPTLCHCAEVTPRTSCMVCVVKDAASDDTLLACATPVREGMDIRTEDEEVRDLRRDTLRLLLEEHAGDCEGPCTRACPAGLDVPRMLGRLRRGDNYGALEIARNGILFPALLGRVCKAPCEGACRRAQYDGAVAIKTTHGRLAESLLDEPHGVLPVASGKTVAVIGAGLAGLAAACTLALHGHDCRIYEKQPHLAPELDNKADRGLLAAEFRSLCPSEIDVCCGLTILPEKASGDLQAPHITLEALLEQVDAVVATNRDMQNLAFSTLYKVRKERVPIRAVASGKRTALHVHAALAGIPFDDKRLFNSRLGRLDSEDLQAYAVERLATLPPEDAGTDPDAPDREAVRCLRCDCLKQHTCKLRLYAERYGVTLPARRDVPRARVAPVERYGRVLYESGKCIKCGICIEITRKHGCGPGMAFSGRGLKTRVQGALGATLEQALGTVADACVEACPTAALAIGPEHTNNHPVSR